MRKIVFVICFIVLGLCINASPIAFGLDSSFDVQYLITNNFELKLVDEFINKAVDEFGDKLELTEEMIDELEKSTTYIFITPPKNRIIGDDKNIEQFYIYCLGGSDEWFSSGISFKEGFSYEKACAYLEKNYGKGLSESNTKFFFQRYSKEPSDYSIASMILNGELSTYLNNWYIASSISQVIKLEKFNHIRMWRGDDVTAFAMVIEKENKSVLLFLNNKIINELVEDMLSSFFSYLDNI